MFAISIYGGGSSIFHFAETDSGAPITEINTVVPGDMVQKLHDLQGQMSWSDALRVVRSDVVPQGYTIIPLSVGDNMCRKQNWTC